MFSTFTPSKYDTTIVAICLCVFLFIFVMISSEIEKSKNKFKDGIIAILAITGIFGLYALASRVKIFEYIFNILMVFGFILILFRDIISFYNKKKYSKGIIKEIKINYGRTIPSICFIITTVESSFRTGKLDLIGIFVIISLLIDLPMELFSKQLS